MKIELCDREAWIERAEVALQKIKIERMRRDATYEVAWAKRFDERGPLRRLLFGPQTRTPPRGRKWGDFGSLLYPSTYASGDAERLRCILQALRTKGTGAVFISGDELRAIM